MAPKQVRLQDIAAEFGLNLKPRTEKSGEKRMQRILSHRSEANLQQLEMQKKREKLMKDFWEERKLEIEEK